MQIDHAVRNEQEKRKRQAAGGGKGAMKVEMNGNGKIAVADTLLSPVEVCPGRVGDVEGVRETNSFQNDPEYMTMRPRGIPSGKSGRERTMNGLGSGESQKRPLLAAAEDDESSEGEEDGYGRIGNDMD